MELHAPFPYDFCFIIVMTPVIVHTLIYIIFIYQGIADLSSHGDTNDDLEPSHSTPKMDGNYCTVYPYTMYPACVL